MWGVHACQTIGLEQHHLPFSISPSVSFCVVHICQPLLFARAALLCKPMAPFYSNLAFILHYYLPTDHSGECRHGPRATFPEASDYCPSSLGPWVLSMLRAENAVFSFAHVFDVGPKFGASVWLKLFCRNRFCRFCEAYSSSFQVFSNFLCGPWVERSVRGLRIPGL